LHPINLRRQDIISQLRTSLRIVIEDKHPEYDKMWASKFLHYTSLGTCFVMGWCIDKQSGAKMVRLATMIE